MSAIQVVECFDMVALYDTNGEFISQLDIGAQMDWLDFQKWLTEIGSFFGQEVVFMPQVEAEWEVEEFVDHLECVFPQQISSIRFQTNLQFTAAVLKAYGKQKQEKTMAV